MRILVTGGEGFIGKYVMSRGKELGYEMTSYDFVNDLDVMDYPLVREYAQDKDAIIHLAGRLGTHELWEYVEDATNINIVGAYNVAHAALREGAQLVCIEQPHIWYNVYEATKLAARRILTGMHYDSGLKVEFVRAHNAFGPGQAYGEGHPQKIIPTFSVKAWRGEPLPVWGDGQQEVNLVYAGDVANSLLTAATKPQGDPIYTWEAGSQNLNRVWEIAEYIINYTDSPSEIEHLPKRKGEQWHIPYPLPNDEYPYLFDRSKLNATIDWYKQYVPHLPF